MKKRIPKSFTLLLFFFLLSNYLSATPDCPILTGKVTTADGTTSDPSATGWYLDASRVASSGYFAAKSKRIHAKELGGEGIWYSRVFSTAGYSEFKVAVKVSSDGDMNSSEYVKIYYKVNGGAETLLQSRTGNFGTIDFISPKLTGSNVQLVVKLYNYNNGGSQTSKYYIEEYRVFKEKGPCTVSAINVTAAAANGGILTCANSSLGLSATATGSGTTTWSWSGPGGFTSSLQNPSVTAGGTYTVVATNSSGTGSASVTVTENKGESVTATAGGALTCATSYITLSGNAASEGVSYTWTGPNDWTFTAQNVFVFDTGIYTLTVYNPATGCSGTDTVLVALNTTPPGASASASGSISCSGNSSVTLSGSSSTSGVTYSWTGPNDFTSTTQNPAVTVAGIYNLTVTNPANGCTSTATNTVTMSTTSTGTVWLEDFTLTNGVTSDAGATAWTTSKNPSTAVISVLNNELRITNCTTTGEAVWTSAAINITGKNNIVISAGTRSSVSNNVLMNESGELMDYLRFYYKLNNGAEVLFAEKRGIINGHSVTPTPVSVTIPNGNYSSLQVIVKGRCTANDEFYYFDNMQVVGTTGSVLDALATATDILTCTRNSVGLTGSSSATIPVNYSWTGPDNFTSALQNPSATREGIYTLTVTDPSTGCTMSDTTLVSINNRPPGVFANARGTLTCTSGSSVTMSTTCRTAGVTFNWTGPNNFTSNEQNPVVTVAGTYNLTVTNPVNGCTSTATPRVIFSSTTTWLEEFTFGNGTASDAGETPWTTTKNPSTAVIAVHNNELRITNCTTTGEAVWTSGVINLAGQTDIDILCQIRSSITNNAVMTETGEDADYLAIYYKLDNGNEILFNERRGSIDGHSTTPTGMRIGFSNYYSTLQIIVRARATGNDEFYYLDNMEIRLRSYSSSPNISASATGGIINCNNNSVALQGSSATSGASYTWAGPGGYTSNAQNPVVTKGGTYTLTVAAGACTGTAAATVIMDTTKPGITASATPVQLTCTATPAVLTGGSSTQGVAYSWSNANGVIANAAGTSVVNPGTYTLTVKNPANGCTAAKPVIVTQNITPPPAITASHTGRVTCASPNAVINGTVSSGLSYSWTGPEGYTANTLTATVRRGGTYTLTATDPVNGCTTSANAIVDESTGAPTGISITNPGSITCLNPIIPLIGFSGAENAIYNWRGPNGYTASSLMIEIQKAGNYTLKVTDTINGCSDSVTTTVIDNAKPPAVTIINTSPLSCTNRVVTLEAVMNIANPQILWSGPGFSSQNAKTTTNKPGNYSLYVGDLDNGCSASFPVKVTGSVTGCAREATGTDNTSSATTQNAATEAITKFEYKAYPNPVTSNGVIEFASPESTTVTVSVYNSLGVCEKVLFKGNAAAQQRYKLAVPATQLPAGAYYYIITTGSKSYTGKLVIVK